MLRICTTLFMLTTAMVFTSTVQAQQSEWIPPLPMPMESLFVPYQGASSYNTSFAPANRQPLGGRFTGNISGRFSGRRNAGIPVAIDSNYGYGNWKSNYGTPVRYYPNYSIPAIQGSYTNQPTVFVPDTSVPPFPEIPTIPPAPAPAQELKPSTTIDFPVVERPKSTDSPTIVIPPAKPKAIEKELEKIIEPRRVSEIPPEVRVPPRKVTKVIEESPQPEITDSFIEVEPEAHNTIFEDIETDQVIEEEDSFVF